MSARGKIGQYLRKADLFNALTDEQLSCLTEVATYKSLSKNETLFLEGESGEAMYLILIGSVQVYTLSIDGREKILSILGPGDFLGELSLLDDEPRSATAQALDQVELVVINKVQFERLLRDSRIAMALLKGLAQRLRKTDRHLNELVFKDIQARLAQVLLVLADEYGQEYAGGRKITLKLTHQQLANYVGSTRESVTRGLLAFQDNGYVSFNRRYLVLRNLSALNKIARPEQE